MIDIIYDKINNFSILISFFFMIMIYFFIITQWANVFKKIPTLRNYNGIQRTHDGEIARFGGIISWLGILIFYLLSEQGDSYLFIEKILISSLPLLIISMKEDLLHNTNVKLRLAAMTLSIFIFFTTYPIKFPQIDFLFFDNLFSSLKFVEIIFFTFLVLVIINGNNLIDGTNGLMPMTIIAQLSCLFYLSLNTDDFDNMNNIIYFATPIILLLFFNNPKCLIFIVETVANFFGFIISMLTIYIYGCHPEIPTWGAVLILFYPGFEVLFSVIRKTFERKSPFLPDPHHLHLKIFHILKNKTSNSRVANLMVMPCLFLIWGMPFILYIFVYKTLLLSVIALIFMTITYIGFYISLPRKSE